MWKQDFSEVIPKVTKDLHSSRIKHMHSHHTYFHNSSIMTLCLQFCPYSVCQKQTRLALVFCLVQAESHYVATMYANTIFQVSTPNAS